MFFPASIAVASLLALSKFTVHSAPVVRCPRRMSSEFLAHEPIQSSRDVVNQFCTGVNGTGTCTPLDGELCTNTPGIQSLILGTGVDCIAYDLNTCEFDEGQGPVLDQFSDLSGLGIQSVECSVNLGNLNDAGLPLDQAQQAAGRSGRFGDVDVEQGFNQSNRRIINAGTGIVVRGEDKHEIARSPGAGFANAFTKNADVKYTIAIPNGLEASLISAVRMIAEAASQQPQGWEHGYNGQRPAEC
ncbi:hypothetical protein K438DRAFT_1935496 [Mycena galopus ATCC 62051]|nr:hypothetical protein K438DRAFT_1935496 [Mycena galopus ATCC 62051]